MADTTPRPGRILVGITGASGTVYARALLGELLRLGADLHLIVSSSAHLVMREELGITFTRGGFDLGEFLGMEVPAGRVTMHADSDLAAGPASGTFRAHAMIICPCSMKTLGMLASGTGSSLIARAADACLKERRRLVVVPRETPLNLIHLRNMVTLTEAGGVVLPAMPGFYHRPATIDDLLRHLVLKILDAAGIDHDIALRWKEPPAEGAGEPAAAPPAIAGPPPEAITEDGGLV